MARSFAKSREQLAEACGVSRTTVWRWEKRDDFPEKGPKGWDVDEVLAWNRQKRAAAGRKAGRIGSGHSPPDEDDDAVPEGLGDRESMDEAERRWRIARANKLELQEQQLRGDLIPREEVAEMLVARARAFQRALRGMGRRLSRRLVNIPEPATVQELLEDAFDNALRHWSGGDDDRRAS